MALWEFHPGATHTRVLVADEGGEVRGILPLTLGPKQTNPLRARLLSPVTESYCGRAMFLVEPQSAETLASLLDAAIDTLPGWDVFVTTLLDDSASTALLADSRIRARFTVQRQQSGRSPHFELPDSWETLFASLPKKFRWTIRSSQSALEKLGALEYTAIDSEPQVAEFLEAVLEIERNSWKEQSGTSITAHQEQQAFYRGFTPSAARLGMLSGHLLRLDGAPIAYIYGLRDRDVFLDLKESFNNTYLKQSPGHVLKRFALERLIARGVKRYDFMGGCEPYKMRWTDSTYSRTTYALYRKNLRGRLLLLRARLAQLLRARRSSSAASIAAESD